MWHLIDMEMSLKECSIYSYTPEDDLFDGEEGSLWSFNYFFFNKFMKRVCYLYLRGVSNIEIASAAGLKTPLSARPLTPASVGGAGETNRSKRCASGTWSLSSLDTGKKRARYWLGDRADEAELVGGDEGDDVEETGNVGGHDDTGNSKGPAGAGSKSSSKTKPREKQAENDALDKDDDDMDEQEHHSRFMNLSSTEEPEDRHFAGSSSARSESPCQGRSVRAH